jgi:tetratricopeptide (TPR) repeat protein
LNPAYLVSLATMESHLAYQAMLTGHFPEARQNLEASAALLDRLRMEKPDDAELVLLAANVAMRRGDLAGSEGHSPDALPFFQQSRELTADYARLRPDNTARARLHLASGLLASSLAENGRYEEALAVLREAEPIIESLLAVEPDNPTYLRQKMAAANYESEIYDNEAGKTLGKPAQSSAAGRRYLALVERLSASDPSNASSCLSLAIACYKLSYPLGKIDPSESFRMAQRALRLFDADLARTPNDRLLRSRRARALRHLAYAFEHNRRPAEARQAIEQAIAIQRQLLAEAPSDGGEREQVEVSQKVLGNLPKAKRVD